MNPAATPPTAPSLTTEALTTALTDMYVADRRLLVTRPDLEARLGVDTVQALLGTDAIEYSGHLRYGEPVLVLTASSRAEVKANSVSSLVALLLASGDVVVANGETTASEGDAEEPPTRRARSTKGRRSKSAPKQPEGPPTQG